MEKAYLVFDFKLCFEARHQDRAVASKDHVDDGDKLLDARGLAWHL